MTTSLENSDWMEKKINDGDINYFKYDEFTNVEKVGNGAFGVVEKADWINGGSTQVALKSLMFIQDNKELLEEVNKCKRKSISNGEREQPIGGTPQAYIDLYQRCWQEDPSERPNIEEVCNILTFLPSHINEFKYEITKDMDDEKNSDEFNTPAIEYDNEISATLSLVVPDDIQEECDNSSSVVIHSTDEHEEELSDTVLQSITAHKEESSVVSQSVDEKSSATLQNINETSDAFYEIVQNYVIYNHVGDSKNFNFTKFLKTYISKSREIFGFLVENPSIQHYELMIGIFYEMGFGIEKNKAKAFDWFKKAGDKGDIYGLYKVGYYYFDGWGEAGSDEEHYKLAFEFYETAAGGELNIAIHRLAFFYEYGFHVQKDYDEAFKLYKKAAENGFIPSQVDLSRFYYSGRGTQRDKVEALKWYQLYQKNGGLINEKQDDGSYIYKSSSYFNLSWYKDWYP
ncbi:897_t:CDS:2 [Funneliformis mosseae]|uniref:897_t:CDS:1 n=1 Tax=Funneliformis mosseae TaxID=27381 RepID=A0A9N8ZTS5_FUNMO|nr:897_t:CDS:2 [Funneliformis mosseae]